MQNITVFIKANFNSAYQRNSFVMKKKQYSRWKKTLI